MRARRFAAIAAATTILALAALGPVLDLAEQPAGPNAFASPVSGVRTIDTNGGRLDWSQSLDLIAFDRRGADGYFDVWTMRPDGSQQACVTCNTPGLPARHVGNPTWHPSGDYIVVQAEKPTHAGTSSSASPGVGFNNDLWLVTRDGAFAWELIDTPADRVTLHPQFSHNGAKLTWGQTVTNLGSAVRVADFVVDREGPRLATIRDYQPVGRTFHETHGFSSDDSKVIFTSVAKGQPLWTFDVFTLDLNTGAVVTLTGTWDQWDEHAQFTPSDQKVVWMSSRDCGCDPRKVGTLKTDLWMMNADGSGQFRLTRLSDSTAPEYLGRWVTVGDMSWAPDRRSLAMRLLVGPKEHIAVLEFSEPQ